MFTTIHRLLAALARLATAAEDLAGTVEETNHGVRRQLGLAEPVPRLAGPAETPDDAAGEPAAKPNRKSR
jgi:hypothetical protein